MHVFHIENVHYVRHLGQISELITFSESNEDSSKFLEGTGAVCGGSLDF